MATAFGVFANHMVTELIRTILKSWIEDKLLKSINHQAVQFLAKKFCLLKHPTLFRHSADNKASILHLAPTLMLKIDKQHVSVKTGQPMIFVITGQSVTHRHTWLQRGLEQ